VLRRELSEVEGNCASHYRKGKKREPKGAKYHNQSFKSKGKRWKNKNKNKHASQKKNMDEEQSLCLSLLGLSGMIN